MTEKSQKLIIEIGNQDCQKYYSEKEGSQKLIKLLLRHLGDQFSFLLDCGTENKSLFDLLKTISIDSFPRNILVTSLLSDLYHQLDDYIMKNLKQMDKYFIFMSYFLHRSTLDEKLDFFSKAEMPSLLGF